MPACDSKLSLSWSLDAPPAPRESGARTVAPWSFVLWGPTFLPSSLQPSEARGQGSQPLGPVSTAAL